MIKLRIMPVLLALPLVMTACGNKAEEKKIDFSAIY